MNSIDEILQNSKLEEKTKQLVKAAYLLGRTEALNEVSFKPLENDGTAEYANEEFTL